MAACSCETGTELFSRLEVGPNFSSLEKQIFPRLTSQDIVEISGESGAGKTELLYHFIICCILPKKWKGLSLGGLNIKVTFIDNDCHFDLFRLITILEKRLKLKRDTYGASVSVNEISLFIKERLNLLHLMRCSDCDNFILTLCSIKNLLCLSDGKNIIMIDGISSFYWSDKMRATSVHYQKLLEKYIQITTVIRKISENCKIPIFVTKRKLVNDPERDKKILGQFWRNSITWHLELIYTGSAGKKTLITLINASNSSRKACAICSKGFIFADYERLHL